MCVTLGHVDPSVVTKVVHMLACVHLYTSTTATTGQFETSFELSQKCMRSWKVHPLMIAHTHTHTQIAQISVHCVIGVQSMP